MRKSSVVAAGGVNAPGREVTACVIGAWRLSPRKKMESTSNLVVVVVAAMTKTMTGAATTPATATGVKIRVKIVSTNLVS